MKYIVDRIEGYVAVCQNLETKKIEEIELSRIPFKIKDGQILKYEDNIFSPDEETEQQRRDSIRNRFNRLKKKNDV